MDKLSEKHVFEAANYIRNLSSIPPRRGLRNSGWCWYVPIEGVDYPPKFLLSVALKYSGDNEEISSGEEFITDEAVRKLRDLKFKPVKIKK